MRFRQGALCLVVWRASAAGRGGVQQHRGPGVV